MAILLRPNHPTLSVRMIGMHQHVARTLLLAVCIGVACPRASHAQTPEEFFGQKTVKLMIAYNPGGTYDLYARLAMTHLPRHLPGHPVMVLQYIPGAGGLTGTLYMHEKAPQDGSELAILPRDIAINQMLRPDAARDDAR